MPSTDTAKGIYLGKDSSASDRMKLKEDAANDTFNDQSLYLDGRTAPAGSSSSTGCSAPNSAFKCKDEMRSIQSTQSAEVAVKNKILLSQHKMTRSRSCSCRR